MKRERKVEKKGRREERVKEERRKKGDAEEEERKQVKKDVTGLDSGDEKQEAEEDGPDIRQGG